MTILDAHANLLVNLPKEEKEKKPSVGMINQNPNIGATVLYFIFCPGQQIE